MINLILSLDYEIFFGSNQENFTFTLIEPTSKIVDICNKYSVPVTLMADVYSLIKHKRLGLYDYNEQVTNQFIEVMKNGINDIQLHIHTHWINSNFNNNKWEFNYDDYRIHKYVKNNNSDFLKVIDEAKTFLEDILRKQKSDYKCIAFRAGGWCLQPTHHIIDSLVKLGILYDSSVIPGARMYKGEHYYDYRKAPFYRNFKVTSNHSEDTCLMEVPVGSVKAFHFNIIKKLLFRHYRKKVINFEMSGATMLENYKSHRITKILAKIWNFFLSPSYLSIDFMSSNELLYILDTINRKKKNDNIFVSIVGHPKTYNESKLKELERFLEIVSKRPEYNFTTFTKMSINSKGVEQIERIKL